jgi:hypothetical protein
MFHVGAGADRRRSAAIRCSSSAKTSRGIATHVKNKQKNLVFTRFFRSLLDSDADEFHINVEFHSKPLKKRFTASQHQNGAVSRFGSISPKARDERTFHHFMRP